ncbi:hypothetical protein [Pseudonocardia sp. ICBG601]|uniref:hypothetical protein n=1 Tax=Pseudonocardia sp. ICBG601 TaxID=2846759 RepID=UPI001CF69AD7|nr:hypothetical protein [Pseudonocardia sp. ICBG601]
MSAKKYVRRIIGAVLVVAASTCSVTGMAVAETTSPAGVAEAGESFASPPPSPDRFTYTAHADDDTSEVPAKSAFLDSGGITGAELARRLERAGYIKGPKFRTAQGIAYEYRLKESQYTISYLVPADPRKIVSDPAESAGDRKVNIGWDNGPRLYMTGTDFWNLGKEGLQEACNKLPWGSRACTNFVERVWTGNLTGPGRILNDGRCWDLSQTLNVGWRPAAPEKCK